VGPVGGVFVAFFLIFSACNSDEGRGQVAESSCGEPSSLSQSRLLRVGKTCKGVEVEVKSFVGSDTLVKRLVFTKPLRRVVVLSSAQIGYMLRLGVSDRIVGVGEGKYIADSALYARVESGEVAQVGNGSTLDYEKLMSLKPDLVMTFATGGSEDDYERLERLGIPAILTSEWQEESPLAKAEWINLYGMIFDEGDNGLAAKADSIFAWEKKHYEEIAAKVKGAAATGVAHKNDVARENESAGGCPRVLAGMNYGGVWYAPGANSYTAQLIRDAGGCYLWAADTSRELRLTLEQVMALADSADVWINPGMFGSAEEILAAEPRAAQIKAFREKRVYQNDGRKGPGGGNDFFESAVAMPSELLQNLQKSFMMSTTSQGLAKTADSSIVTFEWYHNIF